MRKIGNYISQTEKAANDGVASLDGTGNVPLSQLGNVEAGSSSPLTLKGDLYTRGASADARLPIGADGQVLIADSSEPTGLKWQGNNTIGTKVLVQGSVDTTQSFSGGTAEKVDFVDNVSDGFDINSEWDNTNHKFVVGSSGAGVYQFKSAYFIPNNAGWSRIYLEKNGTPIDLHYGNDWENAASSWDTPNGIWNIELEVGDEICFYLYSSTNFSFHATYHSQNTFQITKIGDSVTVNNVVAQTLNKTLTLQEPVNGDSITIFRTDVDITVQEVYSVLVGSATAVVHQLYHHPNRNEASPNALTNSKSVTSQVGGNTSVLDDNTIPADSWVWVSFTAPATATTGQYITIDIRYTE